MPEASPEALPDLDFPLVLPDIVIGGKCGRWLGDEGDDGCELQSWGAREKGAPVFILGRRSQPQTRLASARDGVERRSTK